MNRKIFLIIFSWLLVSAAQAEPAKLALSLKEAETAALESSFQVQAAQADFDAALARSKSQAAGLFPRLSVDAIYRHVSEVPVFKPVPNGPAVPFGDNENYSYGPAISWLAWDTGGTYNRWKSAQAAARSKKFDLDATRRTLILETRLNYFQVQLIMEQVRLFADSLKLAEAQYKDISLQQKAGTLSRIDSLSAHQQVLNRSRDLRSAQSDLAAALRSLFALTHLGEGLDVSIPMDALRLSYNSPNMETSTVLVSLDSLDENVSKLSGAQLAQLNVNHPRLQSLFESAEAAHRTASSLRGGHGPSVLLGAKLTRDYPNGPVLESFNQETWSAVASFPIFEFNRVTNEVRAQESLALSTEKRRDQLLIDLSRDWKKAQDQLRAFEFQESINKKAVEETDSLAKLVYDSYKAGGATYLEVETADLRILQAKETQARIQTQRLMQLAILESLSNKGDQQ